MSESGGMRVLHVVPYFPPDRVGGVGEVAAHLHRALLEGGHDSRVLTAGRSHDDPRVRRAASSVPGFLLRSPLSVGLAGDRDVVHCHHGDSLPFLLALRLRRLRVPVLATFHVAARGMARAYRPHRIGRRVFGASRGNWAYRHLKAPVRALFDAWTLRLADRSSFISRSAAEDLLGPRAAGEAKVIYNGVPLSPTAPDEGAAEPAELLFVGTFTHRKRAHLLPFVLEAVRAERPEARLRIVGARPEEVPDLAGLFRDLGVAEGVIWEGRLPSARIGPFYRASKVLLVPSAYEGLPMVILEAFACGLPCVATRVSGHPEVIEEGVNGYLVGLDRPARMAERCLSILARPKLQESMAAAARRTVEERFGVERQVREYLELYRAMAQR